MVYTIAGLPVFRANLEDEQDGMKRISLVSSPAVEYGFLKFSKGKERMQFSVADEDKQLIYGVLMRANFPIYRNEPGIGEFFVVYSPEVIRRMAEKYIAEGRANNFNLQHEDGSDIEGVQMVQYFIKDTARGIAPAEFPEVEDGSLFGEFRVTDAALWADIKAGKFAGFSLEGLFSLEPEDRILSTAKLADDVKEYINNLNNTKMSKINKIKAALARLVARVQMGSISTDKGVLFWDGDGELEVGFNVYQENEAGERYAAADGEYVIEGGLVIVVANGQVTEIRDVEDPAEQVPAADVEAEEIVIDEAENVEEVVEEIVEEVNDKDERMDAIEARLAAMEERLAAMEAQLADYAKKPAGQPAHEALKKVMAADVKDASSFEKALKYAARK